MILAQPPQHQLPVNTASGKSDPLTEGQIDSLHVALNLSVGDVSVNMHILLCTKLHLSYPQRGRNSPVLVRFFLVCELFQNLCVFFHLSIISCFNSLPMSRLCLQGQKGYPGPPGLPGEPVSIFLHFTDILFSWLPDRYYTEQKYFRSHFS